MASEIKLVASLHRRVYQAMPTPQQAYVLLEAKTGEIASSHVKKPVNFSLVLDRSGSMAGEKLRYMKAAAIQIVDRMGADDLLSVVIFDDQQPAELVIPCAAVQDPERIKARIEAIQERGGTHMSTGMRLGLRELQKGRSTDRVSHMLLLTDGQTWEDEQSCRELADQCREQGIPIYALGLGVGAGSDWDPRLLEDLAQRSGGEWELIDTPEQVVPIFEKTLRGLQGTAVTNAYLTMRMVEGITPRAVWRVAPLIGRLGHQAVSQHDVQMFLGDIQHGVGQSILVDLLLPPRQPGQYRLIQADLSYDVPGTGLTSQRAVVDVVVPFVDDPVQASQMDGRLMNLIERVVAHKLQTQALDEAAAGDIGKATQRLRAAATRLLEVGAEDIALMANQQAEQMERNGQMDSAAAQKMRYATKRLTETDLNL
jgi:Ca-activated chloride channel family protein